ncbi:MAG: four helix bundle protein [Gillisia sp.]
MHNLKTALKEADETEYWLFLCDEMKTYPNCQYLIKELESIIKILNKIISSTTKTLN